MKPLLILIRIICVGIFWSIFFLEGIRVIMLKNWRFDILRKDHWEYAWDLWLSGWVIADAKEWAFVLIILTFIPLWLTGWAALSVINWEKLLRSIIALPVNLLKKIFFQQVKVIASTTGIKKIKKKKSYKEIRPKSVRMPMDEKIYETASTTNNTPIPTIAAPIAQSANVLPASNNQPAPANSQTTDNGTFSHSLFNFDDDDDFEFDFDAFDDDAKAKPESDEGSNKSAVNGKPAPTERDRDRDRNKNKNKKSNGTPVSSQNNNRGNKQQRNSASGTQGSGNSVLDVIKQKGYEVLTGLTIKNTLIDFIGIAANQICICMIDKEPGDWLADEERFNDEEPLWFSESSHRISPVRKADLARQYLVEKLEEADFHFEVKAYVIEQIGNIINAEDMFDIWDEIGVNVCRIDRGTPKEIKPFVKALDETIENIDKDKLEKIKKLIRNIA